MVQNKSVHLKFNSDNVAWKSKEKLTLKVNLLKSIDTPTDRKPQVYK